MDVPPLSSHPIRGRIPSSREGLRPQIGGHTAGKGKIDRPSPRLAKALDDTKHRQELAKADRKRQEEAKALHPEALRRDLEALRRQVKRLEKLVKEGTSNAEA